MKRILSVLLIAVISLVTLSCGDTGPYQEGYSEGFSAGYEKGYDEGLAATNTRSVQSKANITTPLIGSGGSDSDDNTQTYVINKKSKKFHYPTCNSVSQMNESNKRIVTDNRNHLIEQGYSPCGNCNP